MEASQHSLLAACFTLHSINATLAIVPQRGAGLWICLNILTMQKIISDSATNRSAGPEGGANDPGINFAARVLIRGVVGRPPRYILLFSTAPVN
jgi:hypothetical protein